MNTQDTYISGWKTPDDWRKFKLQLLKQDSEHLWREAYKDYLRERLDLRYFHPIKILWENGTFQGEGFSIMAILCTLVEFLESTFQGRTYKYLRKGEILGSYEYSSSQEIFVSFLCNRTPFDGHFVQDLALEFYKSIRCGLLHEAQTRNGWKIWAESYDGKIVDEVTKIVYRNNFYKAFEEFLEDYEKRLATEKELQAAFIRKFDSLCE